MGWVVLDWLVYLVVKWVGGCSVRCGGVVMVVV